jgi:orotidine-5'-phosphate decarboxylase
LEYKNKWSIVLGLTSNAGGNDFQQLIVNSQSQEQSMVPNILQGKTEKRLYEKVLEKVASWGTPENLMFVVGATRASDLENIRNIIPEHFLLVPGVGAQGGSLEEVSKYGMNNDCGLLVNVSRAIIFANSGTDYAIQASKISEDYRNEMSAYLK